MPGKHGLTKRLIHNMMTVQDELDFLRHFYFTIGSYLGPADHEIYRCIADEFLEQYPGAELTSDYTRKYEN